MAEDGNTPGLSPRIVKPQSPSKIIRVSSDPSLKKRMQDLIIDLHGIVQKWELLNQKSFQTLNSLVTSKTQLQSSTEASEEDMSTVSEYCRMKYQVKLMRLRESLIQDHKKNLKAMEEQYMKMERIVFNLEAINFISLEQETQMIPFCTWSVADLFKGARGILNCYTKEWLFKQEISNHFLDTKPTIAASKDAIFLSMWLQQPYLDDNNEYKLNLMLNECGMKSL